MNPQRTERRRFCLRHPRTSCRRSRHEVAEAAFACVGQRARAPRALAPRGLAARRRSRGPGPLARFAWLRVRVRAATGASISSSSPVRAVSHPEPALCGARGVGDRDTTAVAATCSLIGCRGQVQTRTFPARAPVPHHASPRAPSMAQVACGTRTVPAALRRSRTACSSTRRPHWASGGGVPS